MGGKRQRESSEESNGDGSNKRRREMGHWLVLSNPAVFSAEDVEAHASGVVHWGAGRHQGADEEAWQMRQGDRVLLAHHQCPEPAVVASMEVAADPRPDPARRDAHDLLYDASGRQWAQVDLRLVRRWGRAVTLAEVEAKEGLVRLRPLLDGRPLVRLRAPELQYVERRAAHARATGFLQHVAGLPRIPRPALALGPCTAVGASSRVFRASCRGQPVAVKAIAALQPEALRRFHAEVAMVAARPHPSIVAVYGVCMDGDQCMIVSEWAQGSVGDLLRAGSCLALERRLAMARDVVLGMRWLHESEPTIVHRDLKLDNLLVFEAGNVKICDFGFAQLSKAGQLLQDPPQQARGSPKYMAPELFQGAEFNELVDVYSFGIILWELVAWREPYEGYSSIGEFQRAIVDGVRPPLDPQLFTDPMAALLRRCWHPIPAQRPSCAQIERQLQLVTIGYAIDDEEGRRFWRTAFQERQQVPWLTFSSKLAAFLEELGYEQRVVPCLGDDPSLEELQAASPFQLNAYESTHRDPRLADEWARRYGSRAVVLPWLLTPLPLERQLQRLKALLAPGEEAHVTSWQLGNFLRWFGPVVDEGGAVLLLDRVCWSMAQPYFHGDISQLEADQRLAHQQPGCFLVRLSKEVGCFTLSNVTPAYSITHLRLRHVPGRGFEHEGVFYPTLERLLHDNQAQLGVALGPEHYCPGSKYHDVEGSYVDHGYKFHDKA